MCQCSSDKSRTSFMHGMESYLNISGKGKSICSALRMGTNKLEVEQGRQRRKVLGGKKVRLGLEERTCKCCNNGEVEDEMHFVMKCKCYDVRRAEFKSAIQETLRDFGILEKCSLDDDPKWFQLALCDVSCLPLEVQVNGAEIILYEFGNPLSWINKRSLDKLSLAFLADADSLRIAKLESLGFNSLGNLLDLEE